MVDIQTFMLVLAIGNISFAFLVAVYAQAAADRAALRLWQWARLVQGLAHLLGWLRPELPFTPLIVAANTLLIAGFALESGAYARFLGVRQWHRMLLPTLILSLLVYHCARFSGASPNVMTALMSALLASYSGLTAWLLLRGGRGMSRLQRIIGINDGLFCAAMSLRAAAAIVQGGQSVFVPGLAQTLAYLAGYLVMIVSGFGFLLLCKEEDDRKLALLATVDSLTGLLNRRAFFERVDTARALAARSGQPIALMMLDIDHFKRLNDVHGHAAGDEALRVFADSVQRVLREHDIMGRLGGEEFALVMPSTEIDGAMAAAERLRLAVADALVPTIGVPLTMTVSIGVVTLDPLEHIKAALARADHALYAAKSAGRNRVQLGDLVLKRA